MKRVTERLLPLVIVCLLVLAAGTAYAGRADKAGTSAAPELLIPVGAHYIGLGGSALSTVSGVEAIYWNPAGLARTDFSAEGIFSHMNYIADIGVDYAAVGATFGGFGTIGLSFKSLSFGDMEVTTEDNPDGTGQIFSPTYVTMGLTYSRLLTDRVSVGVTANLITERIDRVSSTGFAFNIGVQYSGFASINGLSLGVAIKNLGGAMQFSGSGLLRQANATDLSRPASFYSIQASSDELPSTIELGVAYRRSFEERHALTVSAMFQNNNFSADQYIGGLEYGFDNTIFLRGGYVAYPAEATPETRIFGPTFGAGVHQALTGVDISVDYAYRYVRYLTANHVFSLKLGF